MKTIPFTEARDNFNNVLDQVVNDAEPIVINGSGEGVVVVMSLLVCERTIHRSAPDVSESESIGKRVIGIDDILRHAGNPCLAAYRRHDGGLVAKASFANQSARKDRSQNAFMMKVFVETKLALGI